MNDGVIDDSSVSRHTDGESGWGGTRTPSCQGPNRLQRPWLSFAGPSVNERVEQEGIEPSSRVCKTRVFPLDDSPEISLATRPVGAMKLARASPDRPIANGPSWRVLSTKTMTAETPGIEPDPPDLQPGARTNYTRFPKRCGRGIALAEAAARTTETVKGFEPSSRWLTASRSAAELHRRSADSCPR